MTLTSTIDSRHGIAGIGVSLEVDEGIFHIRLDEACLRRTMFIGICTVVFIGIVVVTIAATEDILYASLDILSIGMGLQHIGVSLLLRVVDQRQSFAADTVLEILHTKNLTTQVVTAIDMVANPREA